MEFIVAEEGIPQNIGCQGALIAYYGSEIEFHYETVPPHGDEIFSAKLPLLELELPFWIYGRNLIFLDAYYLLAETVKKGTWQKKSHHRVVARFHNEILSHCHNEPSPGRGVPSGGLRGGRRDGGGYLII